ncbi:MAG TPA: hypothetical protein VJ808_03395, partial [Gemmatimonadales bacterium]|nr:hypothetical protein [Gemmatimonadales bacterium]
MMRLTTEYMLRRGPKEVGDGSRTARPTSRVAGSDPPAENREHVQRARIPMITGPGLWLNPGSAVAAPAR